MVTKRQTYLQTGRLKDRKTYKQTGTKICRLTILLTYRLTNIHCTSFNKDILNCKRTFFVIISLFHVLGVLAQIKNQPPYINEALANDRYFYLRLKTNAVFGLLDKKR